MDCVNLLIPIVIIQHTNPKEAGTFAQGSNEWKIHPMVESKGHKNRIEKTSGKFYRHIS